ncbi:MAG TPA: hypothetical protein PK513_04875 [Alphaproteobacteria bacterium]|nr:hypothetical protein [Alphaproteobacteria bacterium]USO06414.1 MAG: hypothetical protein H6859_04320 [Rhodospirillales bacterium]HOO81814.1 hypothetical protein [Alphaproteobacteria bacterium]
MAGPLSGIAGQQQVPLAQPSQTSTQNTNGVRGQSEQKPEADRVQPQGAPAAETQNTETHNEDVLQQQIQNALTTDQNDPAGAETLRRGSLVDVVI